MKQAKPQKNNIAPFFKSQVQGDTLEMLVYDFIGDNFTGSGVTLKDIKEQIDTAGRFSNISLRINSPGGDAFEGVAIGSLLKSTGKPVNVFVDGVAASAAAIVAMCGDNIFMAENGLMMIHNAWLITSGNSAELRKTADVLDKTDEAIAQTFVSRTGKSMDEVKAMMDAETWMTAKDAIANGFATKIAGGDDNSEAMALAKTFNYKQYKAVPTQLIKNDDSDEPMEGIFTDCPCDCQACIGGNCLNCTNQECTYADCLDCPMQDDNTVHDPDTDSNSPLDTEPSNISLYQAKAALAKMRATISQNR